MMTDKKQTTLVIFRCDLRVADNLALYYAFEHSDKVIALYVLDDQTERLLGGASCWWLHHSLLALGNKLAHMNIPLILRKGIDLDVIKTVAEEYDVDALVWNRSYDRGGVILGRKRKTWASEINLTSRSFNSTLLHEPFEMRNKSGGFFKVFSPFWRACLANDKLDLPADLAARAQNSKMPPYNDKLEGWKTDKLDDWDLLPQNPNWAEDFSAHWQPGEDGAFSKLETFLDNAIARYSDGRDYPGLEATSRLSAHLRFGEISPARVIQMARARAQEARGANVDKFLAEIGWREFCHHLLFHRKTLQTENFNPKFDNFPWYQPENKAEMEQSGFHAWTKGMTGYPIVDAGMRQLWQTGWMHNRVRMIAGSFLVKHLLVDWRKGEEWFWDTLVDACPANNTAGWQWIAGSGADAAPYFRIFNPILQGEKFDSCGDYIRKFVPELSNLPNKIIHKPWTIDADALKEFGVTLGETYPTPIVDHGFARDRALKAFKNLSAAQPQPS